MLYLSTETLNKMTSNFMLNNTLAAFAHLGAYRRNGEGLRKSKNTYLFFQLIYFILEKPLHKP